MTTAVPAHLSVYLRDVLSGVCVGYFHGRAYRFFHGVRDTFFGVAGADGLFGQFCRPCIRSGIDVRRYVPGEYHLSSGFDKVFQNIGRGTAHGLHIAYQYCPV